MKPVLLTLQAVGPYAGRQSVDFRSVLDVGLFGIYGATGSGKSTIFSAMTFALFGEAARSEQHVTTLRSDHADPSLLTQVELIFEAGGRTYRIVRQPEQTRPARRGGGETSEKHKAWLFDVTGLDLDNIRDAIPGKVVAETKVMLVDNAIVKILGYGAAQFRQIVLLPQGRFEAFLSADTKARLEILRELFDVSLYRRLAEHAKANADQAQKEIEKERERCVGRLLGENFESMTALAEGIADADLRHRDLHDVALQAKTNWELAVTAYQRAAQTDASFKDHLDAQQDLARIDAMAEEIVRSETRLKLARIVLSLADAAAARDAARMTAEDARRRQDQTVERLQSSESNARLMRERFNALTRKSAEIEQHKTTLQTLRTYETKLQDSENLNAAALEAHRALHDRAAAVQKAKANQGTLTSRSELTAKSLQMAQSSELRRTQLMLAIADLEKSLGAATSFDEATRKLVAAQDIFQRKRSETTRAEALLTQAQAAHAEAETTLLKDHAAHLSAHLKPGVSCPVCGSSTHPAPAHGAVGNQRLDDAYARTKTELETARKLATDSRTQVTVAQQAVSDRATELDAQLPPNRPASVVATELQSKKNELAGLGAPVDINALQSALETLQGEIKTASAKLEEAQKAEADAAKASAVAQSSCDDAIATIPHELRNAATLLAQIESLEVTIRDFINEREAATVADREAGEALSAAKREAETVADEVNRLLDQLAKMETSFAMRLSENGLTPQDYEARKSDVSFIQSLEAEIQKYALQRAAAETRLHRTAEIIASLDRPDLMTLATARDDAAALLEKAQSEATTARARLAQLEKLQSDLAAEGERLDKLEKETAPLRELADAFTGRSYQKIDLETFAISTLFDRVLDAANLRLSPMTRGRYSLVREFEGRGNARRGLGIAVEDTYTGRQRPTSTLSGGETFIAALALALGLSDIVESAHGSVRLDTIFIDEGFGSLDSDGDSGTLETVLQTLQDIVGTSRAVGLISHVPLVQQAIPNGFFVTKTPAGSHIEIRN